MRRFFRRVPANAETRRAQGANVYWMLAISTPILLLAGWFLPWFVTAFSGGVGFSAQDAVSSAPTGVGTILLYGCGLAMIVLVVSPIAELAMRLAHRDLPPVWRRVCAIAAPAGFVLALVVWLLVYIFNEEPLFGTLAHGAFTNAAVWMFLYGFYAGVVTYTLRDWVFSKPNLAFAAAGLPFGALLPLMFHQSPDFISWATTGFAIYMVMGLGLNVVVGFAGLLDLGYAAFFAIGAYTCASLASPRHHVHLSLWLLIFIGAGVASSFGAILGAPTLRLRGDYLAIVTLGFGEIIPDLAQNNVLNLTGGPNGISGIDKESFLGLDFALHPEYFYWALIAATVVVVILLRNLERSRIGRAWVALREDEVAAAATGINTTSTKLLAFAIGASVSGLVGAFYGEVVSVVTFESFQFQVSVTVLAIVVLGGIGNIVGVILGGFVLSFVIGWVLPNLNDWSGTLSHTVGLPALGNVDLTQFTYIIYGAALILMMLFRPGGLLPSRARRIELQRGVESESLAAVQGKA